MRFATILLALLPFALAFWRDHRRWFLWGRGVSRSDEHHAQRAERLVDTLARLGPTFVKGAQVFAGRSDILAVVYAKALTRLTDQVPGIPLGDVLEILHSEYGGTPEDIFDTFERTPLAAASLGQVHRATLGGEEVVVKVLRPDVEALVMSDLLAARQIVTMVLRVWPNPHVVGAQVVIDEFALRIGEELDFRVEAAHAIAVRANFAGRTGVTVPRVYHAMVRRRALVLEYCEGRRIDQLDEWVAEGRVNPDALVRGIMDLYAQMMLIDGLYHADPHPGNVHVSAGGRIILLDFGMVIRVPIELRRELVAAIFAAVRKDASALAESFHRLGLVVAGADRAVIERLASTLLAVSEQRTTTRERVELLANEVLAELYDWPIVLPSHLVYFARTASLIEGIGTHYDPHFNALQFATPVALALRERIVASLYPDGGGPVVDPARVVGAAIGAVARIVRDASRDIVSAVRQAVTVAALPSAESLRRPGGSPD